MTATKEQVRASIAAHDPALLELMDALRERFEARLVWVRTPDLELGREPEDTR